jgi:protein SCO1
MISRRTIKTMTLVIALAMIGVMIGIYTEMYYRGNISADNMDGVFWPDPKQIGPFNMIDHKQNEFGLEQLKGRWTFMFFGYTSCPDLCPTTMAVLNEVARQLKLTDKPEDIQVIFITVDPERDSIDKLSAYIAHFNDEFIGLGGIADQVDSLASQIGITYFYEPASIDGSYLVSHTGSIFLLDPKARLISMFSPPFNPMEIQTRFIEIKNFISRQD